MAQQTCDVCVESQAKYKCVCSLRYCSVNCYKTHNSIVRGRCCKPKEHRVTRDESRQLIPSDSLKRDFPREDTVPPRLLEYLQGSRELRTTLQNPHLRDLLTKLASQSDPARMLDQLMQEPLFIEFADVCMNVIEPPEE
ncbi:zinc finger HIT domain-containing protein 3-like [Varroa jacobsoni]|uniref:zinc finger HIT domain-containing protein 3-like n=1 Tax=Varroa jacobsoni TaxID=62625 RepID=UPI000BF2E4DA|nr:zinc finger HIT domain-containing protein 3-like [Varroa jacobsoni]